MAEWHICCFYVEVEFRFIKEQSSSQWNGFYLQEEQIKIKSSKQRSKIL